MVTYIGPRLLISIPVILGVATLVFFMLHFLPGDPVMYMLSGMGGSEEDYQRLRTQLGLQDPVSVQYVRFITDLARGDLGDSIYLNRPVLALIRENLPSTFQLTLAAMGIAMLVGVTLGIIAAVKEHTWIDQATMALALGGVSIPDFWLGLLMIYFLAIRLRWLPITGQGGLQRLIMPATVLGLTAAGLVARLVRSSMVEVLRQDYIVTARAKGLRERVVLGKHALRNVLIPVVTVVGLQFGRLLSGSLIVETIFARQGIGRLAINAVLVKDFPLVQGTVLFIACVYVLVNLLVDFSYAVIDPRIRYG
jgi:ABC-type dipeptide/oligopeptide/nickel transport system permease component